MKTKTFILKLTAILLIATMFSCQQQLINEVDEKEIQKNDVPQEVLEKLAAAGFNTAYGNVQKTPDGGYTVDGDIYFGPDAIDNLRPIEKNDGPFEERYLSNLGVNKHRQIRVYINNGFSSYYQNALNQALERFNALNLNIQFERVYSYYVNDIKIEGGAESNFNLGEEARADYPDAFGKPGKNIKTNPYYFDEERSDAVSVFTHLLGHSIGFRHTDQVMDSFTHHTGVGANHVPGTQAYDHEDDIDYVNGELKTSWMFSKLNGTDRPFNTDDIIALEHVFGSHELTGETLLCEGDYTITFDKPLPPFSSVSWKATPAHLFENSEDDGTTAHLKKIGNGEGKITFYVKSSLNGEDVPDLKISKTIWVGEPSITTNPAEVPTIFAQLGENITLQAIIERADLQGYDNDFFWSLPDGSENGINLSHGNYAHAVAECMQVGTYFVRVSASNDCGMSTTRQITINISSGGSGPGKGML